MKNSCLRSLLTLFVIFMGSAVASAQVSPTYYWGWDTGFNSDIGGVTGSATGNVTTVEGRFGNAVQIDPSAGTARITVPNMDAFFNNDYTFATWVNIAEYNRDNNHAVQLFGNWNSPHPYRFYVEKNATTGLLTYATHMRFAKETGHTEYISNGNSTFSEDEWVHVATAWNEASSTMQLYVNGALAASRTLPEVSTLNLMPSSATNDFGYKQDGGGQLNGMLDETYIYDKSLSAAQIYGLFTQNDAHYFPKYTASSIPLEKLNGSTKDMVLIQAIEQGAVGKRADTTNLGIVGVRGGDYGGNPGTFVDPVLNLVGGNGSFDLTNLAVGTGGVWGNGNQNGTIKDLANNNLFFIKSDATIRQSITNGVGMHANAFVTYDVNELREAGSIGANQLMQFTAYGGVRAGAAATTNQGKLNMAVILWGESYNVLGAYVNGQYAPYSETDGTWSFDTNYLNVSEDNAATTCLTPAKSAFFDIAVTPDVSYISVVSTQGNDSPSSDHAILANPKLNILSPKTVWLNQLFGFQQGDDKTRLQYANHQNDGAAAKAADGTLSYCVLKAEGNALAGGAVNLIGDNGTPGAILFNAVALGPMAGLNGGIISNRCGGNATGGFDVSANDVLRDFGTLGYTLEGAIGMHADALLTYDLDALRSLNCWGDAVLTFNTDAAMAHTKTGANQSKAHALVLLSDDTSIIGAYLGGENVTDLLTDLGGGVMGLTTDTDLFNELLLTGNDAPINFNFDIMSDATYLSLLAVANGSLDTDHLMFLNPTLTAAGLADGSGVPEPATWVMLLSGVTAVLFFRRRRAAG